MLANRVREYTLTIGTGDITLAGAMVAHIRFSDAFAVGETVTYVIEDGDNYEIGTGTLVDATTLRRTAVGETLVDGVYDRSAPDAIALSGSARVYCAATAEFLLDPTEAADVIREVTLDAGVTVDGVLLKDGGANLTGDLVSGGAVGVGIAPAYTLDIENPDTNFYVGRWKRQGTSLPGFLYSDTAGAGFTFGTNAFSGSGSKGGLYFGNNANIYLPENNGDLFIVDGSSRVRYAFRDDGVLTWNSGATGIEGSGYLSWATNKAIVSAKSGAFDLVLRGGGSDNLTLGSDGSSVFGGNVRVEGNAVLGNTNISRDSNVSALYLSGGDTEDTGANALLFAGNHPTKPGDMLFRSGTTTWMQFLNTSGRIDAPFALHTGAGAQALTLRPGTADHVYIGFSARSASPPTRSGYVGYPSAGGTAMVFNNELVGGQQFITNGVTWLNVSSTGVAEFSGNVRVAGSLQLNNHQALNWLDSGGSPRNGIVWDASNNLNLYSGQSNAIQWLISSAGDLVGNGGSIIRRNLNTSTLTMSGGLTGSQGGAIILYGNAEATNANDLAFLSAGGTKLNYDADANHWDFQGNILRGMTQLVRGISTSSLRLCGGTSFVSGANIVVHGEHLNDIEFKVDTSVKLSWDDSANHWNFQNNIVDNIHDLFARGEIATWGNSSDFLSGASRAFFDYVPGSNLARFGHVNGASGTQADLGFYSGGALKLLLDISAAAWNFQGQSIAGLGQNLTRSVNTDFIRISGGDSAFAGANILLSGGAHPTTPNNIQLRTGSTDRLVWDNSANHWNFQGNDIVANLLQARYFLRGIATSDSIISGGTNGSSGGNILLYGESHATQANDIAFRTGNSYRLQWDDDANQWNFYNNVLKFVSSLYRGSTNEELRIGGGNGADNGANVEFYGGAHPTNPSDIKFRKNSDDILSYSSSGFNWNFRGNEIKGVAALHGDATSTALDIYSGTDTTGANIILYGSTHGVQPNDILFRTGATTQLQWDSSADLWNFHGKQITNTRLITAGDSTGTIEIGGGSAVSGSGANLFMYGPAHLTRPNDFELRAGTTSVLRWDDGVSQLEIAQRMTVDTGGQSFTLLPGSVDHAYMAFNARTASPTARSGYIGYASASTAGMSFVNELVGPQQFITNGITWLIGSSSGAATFFGNVINQSQMQLKSYMVANLPSASSPGAGSVIFVTDDAGGPVPAFSDGINFRRITDRNIVSSSAITELTISSGAITITKSFHAIDTESDASSDELDTINGGQDGDEITLVAEDDARSITLRHNIGNIRLSGSNNFTLSSLSDTITLIKRGANWLEKSRSNSS